MNDLATSTTPRKFPRRSFNALATLTVLVVIGISLVLLNMDFLNEKFNLNPGIPNVVAILLAMLGVITWIVWLVFWAKKYLLAILVFAMAIGPIVFFHPDFDGDAGIRGFKPRFLKSEVKLSELVAGSESLVKEIDLKTKTPFDSPQFFGPNRDGKVDSVSLADDWNSLPPKLIWKDSVGPGWSGFAAVNGYAVTQEQRGEMECVTCYEIETGKPVWIYSVERRHEDLLGLGKVGPRATPSIDEGRVYAMGGTGVLDCIDGSNGKLIWSHDIAELVGIKKQTLKNSAGLQYLKENSSLEWGRSSSPLIHGNMVIVAAGKPAGVTSEKSATLIAFDKITGQEIWRGGQRAIAYGSPTIATILGKPQVLLVAEDHAVGHDIETGAEMWCHARSGSSGADANCSQVTVVDESRLLLSKGYNMGGEIIELCETNGKIEVKSLKTDPRILKTKLTNPVIFQGHAFCLSDGYLECSELGNNAIVDKSGAALLKRKWKQRGRFGNGQILLVGDKLLVHSEEGELMLIAADVEKYRVLGEFKTISGSCWNKICLYGNRLLVRSDAEMACVEIPLKEK